MSKDAERVDGMLLDIFEAEMALSQKCLDDGAAVLGRKERCKAMGIKPK